ncbi:hydroxymethylbilane synthase [Kaistia algarum]|uniref:hydroxymethylbilane synthase n=1 Tax=Kaistia algarum TaxID=2083279 RepID=UPI00224EFCA1|nr:hydroxymethylbilane synthase [Kaistia algarum]MCX5514135.1 hydroxymethylbilane synthase [Kaistia algarum]
MQSDRLPPVLRIGTRGSPLALAQAHEVRARLSALPGMAVTEIEVVVIRTSGDRIQDRPLSEVGGKGLFTKEIEAALLSGEIDLAVHSSKDVPTVLPDGLELSAFLPREDVRDAFLSPVAETLQALPQGAVLGTSSLRRRAMALRLRPDLRVVEFRGNVETRMRKLDQGVAQATLLAKAGLNRLGLAQHATSLLDIDDFLPAVGQGAVAIETRADDWHVRERVQRIGDEATGIALSAERAFLEALDGSCRTPIGGLATIEAGRLIFRGMVLAPDGSRSEAVHISGEIADATVIGKAAADELIGRGGREFFREA